MSGFSSALKLTDLNDFITPSQECILPTEPPAMSGRQAGRIRIENEDDAMGVPSVSLPPLKTKVNITLGDCLACSGCVTTAESVLVSQQSTDEMLRALTSGKDKFKLCVATISPQSRASISVRLKISLVEADSKIKDFLYGLGFDIVPDSSLSRSLALQAIYEEFTGRLDRDVNLPLLTSACPGWVCYAEKSHGDYILPYISRVRSPQAIMGAVVKDFVAKTLELNPDEVYHATVMPCFDKKLEASRPDFVVNTSELNPDEVYHATVMPCFDKKLEASRPDFVVNTSELNPDEVYHATVMPCFDKKLEASRPDFVVNTSELNPDEVYHATVMPCFDKKLEASRPDFVVNTSELNPDEVYHATVMPCFDKKLEASRPDFVVNTSELNPDEVYHATVMPCFDKKLEASRPDFVVNTSELNPDEVYHATVMSCFDKKLEASRPDFVVNTSELNPDEVYHATVMPCFDKKLEASRPDFVVNTSELNPDEVYHATVMPCFDKKLEASRPDFVVNTSELNPDEVYHATVMPCFDKKLEASRPDFVVNTSELNPDEVYHATVMPCFDKKLEASRPDFVVNTSELNPDEVYHATVMPCFDKKLEASRPDFVVPGTQTREVDCVISTAELEELMTSSDRDCARPRQTIKRNVDLQECELSIGDRTVVIAKAYGFRNIQTVVQRIKRNKAKYQFVEIMACPQGCINGGGQIRSSIDNKELLAQVTSAYESCERVASDADDTALTLMYRWLGGLTSDLARRMLYTDYHAVPKSNFAILNSKW